MRAGNDNHRSLSVDDLSLGELWALVMSGQMPEARYREIEAERAARQPRLVDYTEFTDGSIDIGGVTVRGKR